MKPDPAYELLVYIAFVGALGLGYWLAKRRDDLPVIQSGGHTLSARNAILAAYAMGAHDAKIGSPYQGPDPISYIQATAQGGSTAYI